MQIIISEKCTKCGYTLRSYNKKRGKYFFGPRVVKCPKCGQLYHNDCGVELATLTEERVKKYAREYSLEGNFLSTLILLMILLWAIDRWSSINLDWLNYGYNGLILIIAFALIYFIVSALKCIYFWKVIVPDSEKRMNDPEYVDLIRTWNEMRFGISK